MHDKILSAYAKEHGQRPWFKRNAPKGFPLFFFVGQESITNQFVSMVTLVVFLTLAPYPRPLALSHKWERGQG
jgi:hypothetical protein